MSFQKPLPKPQAKIEMANVEMAKPAPLSAQDPERKFRKLVRSIHTGEAGGLIGQIFAFLAACGAIILVWTGFGMARRRFFAASIKLNK